MNKMSEKQYLLVSIFFDKSISALAPLSKLISQHHSIIRKSQLLTLGDKQGLQMQINGPWHEIVKLENELNKFAKKSKCNIILDRANKIAAPKKTILYSIEFNASENTDTLDEITGFFAEQNIHIYEMNLAPYVTNPLSYNMQHLQMYILIPESYSIPELREDFVNLCDELNIDAYLEPAH